MTQEKVQFSSCIKHYYVMKNNYTLAPTVCDVQTLVQREEISSIIEF